MAARVETCKDPKLLNFSRLGVRRHTRVSRSVTDDSHCLTNPLAVRAGPNLLCGQAVRSNAGAWWSVDRLGSDGREERVIECSYCCCPGVSRAGDEG